MKNIKIDGLKISKNMMALLMAGAISFSLVGCGINETKTNDNKQITKEEIASSASTDNFIDKEFEKVDGDNAVTAAITIMIDSAKSLAESADNLKDNKSYQETKKATMDNFDTLLNFLFNDKEIDGYTIHDVSDSTVQTAKEGLKTLDEYIEKYIPEYKDKAKEKLAKFGAWLWDKSTDAGAYLKEKGSEWLNDVTEKYNEKQR